MLQPRLLIALAFWVGLAVNLIVKLRMIRQVKVYRPDDPRFHYFHWWVILDEIGLWQEHRRFYPESRLRLIYLLTGPPMVVISVIYLAPYIDRFYR